MTLLIIASALFVLIHVLPSTPLRAAAVGAIGEKAWTVGFSVASLAGIAWMLGTWGDTAPGNLFYAVSAGLRHASTLFVLLSLLLVVIGLATPGDPSLPGPAKGRMGEKTVRGIRRVTRHPFLFGAGLWALTHMVVNPNARDWVFFGAFALLSFGGAMAQDRRLAKRFGEAYQGYIAKTSFVPFAAIVTGRNELRIGEIGWWRIVLGFAVFVVLLLGHPWLFGVAPLG